MSIVVVNVHGVIQGDKSTVRPVVKEEAYAETPDIESLVEQSIPDTEEPVGLRDMSEFTKKDDLEAYGKEFGTDLNKTKTIANMYADLVAFINA